jgi:hypothetical protein
MCSQTIEQSSPTVKLDVLVTPEFVRKDSARVWRDGDFDPAKRIAGRAKSTGGGVRVV